MSSVLNTVNLQIQQAEIEEKQLELHINGWFDIKEIYREYGVDTAEIDRVIDRFIEERRGVVDMITSLEKLRDAISDKDNPTT